MDSLLQIKIKQLINSKNTAETRLIKYILEHPREVVETTINGLSERADVSYATVCRLVSRLGFDGFKAFKSALKEEAPWERLESINTEIDLNSSVGETVDSVCNLAVSVVRNCRVTVGDKDLEAVVKLLKSARNVYFVGVGTAAVTAHYACTKLFRLKVQCAYDSDMIIAKMKVSLLEAGDILFAISSSGRTKAVIELARLAGQRGVTVITLSDFVATPLEKYSDISLCTTSCDSGRYADDDFPLVQGQITVIDMIYNCCFVGMTGSTDNFNRTKLTVENEKLPTNRRACSSPALD